MSLLSGFRQCRLPGQPMPPTSQIRRPPSRQSIMSDFAPVAPPSPPVFVMPHTCACGTPAPPASRTESIRSAVDPFDAPVSVYEPHSSWYLDGSDVEWLVGATVFKLPQLSFIRGSAVYRDMVSADNQAGSQPVKLTFPAGTDVTSVDFERFLEILYPRDFEKDPFDGAEWFSVFRVAHYLEFSSIRRLAISRLEKVEEPVQKVVHGKAYDVQSWVIPGYTDLCRRQAPLSFQDGQRLGWDVFAKLTAAREEVRRPNFGGFGLSEPVEDVVRRTMGLSAERERGLVDDLNEMLGAAPPAVGIECLGSAVPKGKKGKKGKKDVEE